jgi:hypothetical protein
MQVPAAQAFVVRLVGERTDGESPQGDDPASNWLQS